MTALLGRPIVVELLRGFARPGPSLHTFDMTVERVCGLKKEHASDDVDRPPTDAQEALHRHDDAHACDEIPRKVSHASP
jgi:hypothetical protein